MTVYLDPSNPPGVNLALMANHGATTTKRGAELAGKIDIYHSKGNITKPRLALIIGGIVTGIILALVLSNPVFLLVGFGFSAIDVGLSLAAISVGIIIVYNHIKHIKLIKAHSEERKNVETIIQNISQYLEGERASKIVEVIGDASFDIMQTGNECYKTKLDARARVAEFMKKYDGKGYSDFRNKVKVIYGNCEKLPISEHLKRQLILSASKVLEKPTVRPRINISYDSDHECFMPSIEDNAKVGMLVDEESESD